MKVVTLPGVVPPRVADAQQSLRTQFNEHACSRCLARAKMQDDSDASLSWSACRLEDPRG